MKNFCQTHVVSRSKIGPQKIVNPSEKLHKISEQIAINPSGKFDKISERAAADLLIKSNKIAGAVNSDFSDSRLKSLTDDSSGHNLKLLTDQNLYQLCKTYGERARLWRQKFAGLLPEVFRRKLYEKKGFSSIFEFAKKLAGMSEEQVKLTLNLEKRFAPMPVLQNLLIKGEISINKLTKIVSIAKPENQEFLARQVQILSKGAVETLVRDEKYNKNYKNQNDQGIICPDCQSDDFKNQKWLI